MPRSTFVLTLTLLCLVLAAMPALAVEPAPQAPNPQERLSAPVLYGDMMIIVSTKDGTAAFVFDKEIENGVNYRFRFLDKNGKDTLSGDSQVFEKYLRVLDNFGNTTVIDQGGQLFLIAGEIKIEWSLGKQGRGWIYYTPETARIQIGNAKDFEKIDLKRFAM